MIQIAHCPGSFIRAHLRDRAARLASGHCARDSRHAVKIGPIETFDGTPVVDIKSASDSCGWMIGNGAIN